MDFLGPNVVFVHVGGNAWHLLAVAAVFVGVWLYQQHAIDQVLPSLLANKLFGGKRDLAQPVMTSLQRAQRTLADRHSTRGSHLYAVETLKTLVGDSDSDSDRVPARRLLADGGTWQLSPDFHKAHGLYQQLAEEGDAHGLYMLGIFHAEGIVVSKDFTKALAYFTFAAKNGSRGAQLTCAYLHGSGVGVEKSDRSARRYLQLAAEDTVTEIRDRNIRPLRPNVLFSLDGSSYSSSSSPLNGFGGKRMSQRNLLEFYQFSSSQSSPSTLMMLGQIYYYGSHDIEVDLERAKDLFQMALDKGATSAYGFLGQMHLRGEGGLSVDHAQAFRYFRAGVEASSSQYGDKDASIGTGLSLNGLGLCYWHGWEVAQDENEALEYFLKAIQAGSVEAMYNAASLMLRLDPIAYHDLALELLMEASKHGFLLANHALAKLHSRSDRMHNLCVYLWRTFFERFSVQDAVDEAHDLFANGSLNQAYSRLVVLSWQGFERAQATLARHYLRQHHRSAKAKTTAKKKTSMLGKRAATWFFRAAQQGDIDSRNKLGDVFLHGTGLPEPVPAAAMANYLISLHGENVEGAYDVGYMYEHGISVPRCLHFARLHYAEALLLAEQQAARKDASAAQRRYALASRWPVQVALLRVALKENLWWLQALWTFFKVVAVLSIIAAVAWVVVRTGTMDLRRLLPRRATSNGDEPQAGPYRQDTPLLAVQGEDDDYDDDGDDIRIDDALLPLLEEQ